MLKISENLFSSLEMEQREKLSLKCADFLRQKILEAHQVDRFTLAVEIDPLIVRGQTYDLSTERELSVFVLAATYLGHDFDTELPEVMAILKNPRLNSSEKAEELEAFTILVVDQLEKQQLSK